MNRVHGLTLIEVAIAILVVTLLFAVGLPAYQNQVARQIVEEAIDIATPAKETVQEYADIHGRLPATADIALPFVTSKYVAATSWAASGASGTITVSTRLGQHGEADVTAVVLTASYNAATRSVAWTCGGTSATTISADLLPNECRSRQATS